MGKTKKVGRPKKGIDYNQVESLAKIMCTQKEIAEVLGVSTRTLQRDDEFCRIYNKGKEEGKTSLRRMQYKSALNGSVSMQIWLGKQYLQQKDQVENTEKEKKVRIINDLPK